MNPSASQVVDYHVKGVEQHGKFKVANNSVMQHILSDQLYGDKISAVIREISTNAFEAHMMDGHNEPFDVHLPTMNEPWFSVRDYGIGLSQEKMVEYSTYGASDKRHSDDFTGGLGIGSKSPYAYTKMYTVTSYYNGEKIICVNSQNEMGEYVYDIISVSPTTESNGLEIYFDVEDKDIPAFTEKASQIYRYFDVLPKATGNSYTIAPYKYIVEKDNWKILETKCELTYTKGWKQSVDIPSRVIMGQVAYPIDRQFLDSNAQHVLSNCAMEIRANMNEVQFTPNREALQYTDVTKKYLNQICHDVMAHLKRLVDEQIGACQCKWDARLLAHELFGGSSIVGNIVRGKIKYKGEDIDARPFIYSTELISYHVRAYEFRSSFITEKRTRINVKVNKHTVFLIAEDEGPFAAAKRYAANNSDKFVYVFSPKHTGKATSEFLEMVGLPPNDSRVIYTNSIPKAVRAPYQAGPKVKRHPMDADVWVRDDGRWSRETINLDNESGYYCVLEKFMINGHINSDTLELLTGKHKIIGVLESRSKKVKEHSNWKPIVELVKEQVDKAASHPDICKYADIDIKNIFSCWDLCLTKYDSSSTMRKNLEKIKENRSYQGLVNRLKSVASFYQRLGHSYQLPVWKEESIDLLADYPLLKFFRDRADKNVMGSPEVVEYINSK